MPKIEDAEEEEKIEGTEFRKHSHKSEERRATLDMNSDEMTLKEFLNNKQREWEKVKQNLEDDIKIKHLFIFSYFFLKF